ncbi:DUF2147 domain-containing protein [Yoonia sp. 2307UL14-13]|uniref:DUF2147 domain-containing protein n=1 Tax=Yoonia sp. 2307UL14-13 TaxID=3126506 RepID=UPI0030AF6232
MKTFLFTAIAAIGLGTMAMADPLEGTWQTGRDDNGNFGHIRVAPCGAQLCGTLVRSFDSSGNQISTEFDGRNIISQTVARGSGEYRGKVYAPDRDKTYNSRLQLSGNSLSVSGCVLGICRNGGTWTRVQ